MHLFKKLELLLNATTRSKLPRRWRQSALDAEEEKLLAQVREAVAGVRAQEQKLADQLRAERVQAEAAGQQGNRDAERLHKRRAAELERQLKQESIQAINLEQKLAALEEKLALAREAVAKQQAEATAHDEAATRAMAQESELGANRAVSGDDPPGKTTNAASPGENPPDLQTRKSRLSE